MPNMSNATKKTLKSSIALLFLCGVLLILLGLCLILWPRIIVLIIRWTIAVASIIFGLYILIHTCVHAFR